MPWFIVQTERKTWTKYLVEANDEESALASSDNWEYWGYLDGDDTDSDIIAGPFETRATALADAATHTDG